jgi:hypothetical protein
MRVAPLAAVLFAPIVFGCAFVDRESYESGETGTTSFWNPSREPLYLDGCSPHGFEKLEARGWTDRGPAQVCVWEGYAQPVEARQGVTAHFWAPDEPGTWRLAYTYGRGCDPEQPLAPAHCTAILATHTPAFEVVELCEPVECGPQLGMPNILCSDGIHVAGPTDRCLRDPATRACGWEILSCPEDGKGGG